MKTRIKSTGKIVEVELANTYRFNDGSFVEVFRDLNADTLYFRRDLDFDIEGKFAENCLNGIKQGIVHDSDYWTRLEHQYAGQFMQAMISSSDYIDVSEEAMADASLRMAHALVEKYKKEERK